MTDKVVLIKEKLKAARDHQKSYVGNRRKQLGFEVGDKVILEVSSWKRVLRLERKTLYLMCFNLKKYLADANLHVHLEEIKVNKTLCFVEEPVEIIDREFRNVVKSATEGATYLKKAKEQEKSTTVATDVKKAQEQENSIEEHEK
ncbi:hypothetical protein Tco_0078199 [Tanacetum coccineum]